MFSAGVHLEIWGLFYYSFRGKIRKTSDQDPPKKILPSRFKGRQDSLFQYPDIQGDGVSSDVLQIQG